MLNIVQYEPHVCRALSFVSLEIVCYKYDVKTFVSNDVNSWMFSKYYIFYAKQI